MKVKRRRTVSKLKRSFGFVVVELNNKGKFVCLCDDADYSPIVYTDRREAWREANSLREFYNIQQHVDGDFTVVELKEV